MSQSLSLSEEMEARKAFEEAGLVSGSTPVGLCGHDLQLYRTEAHLVKSVVSFAAEGLRAGHPLVIIATEAHRRAFSNELRAVGLNTEEPYSGHEALWLDARETLTAFMEGPTPNPELFMNTVGAVFERLIKRRNYLIVRAYGEMVDLLWKDGNTSGAIMVERLWNELAAKYSFALLCAYSFENFLTTAGADGLRHVCAQHARCLPLEAHPGRAD